MLLRLGRSRGSEPRARPPSSLMTCERWVRRLGLAVVMGPLLSCMMAREAERPPSEDNFVLHRGGAERIIANFEIPHAGLDVRRGNCGFLKLRARYRPGLIEPQLSSSVDESGLATVVGRELPLEPRSYSRGKWELCVGEEVPTELDVQSNGGHFSLEHLNIGRLNVDGGEGHVELDLTKVERPLQVVFEGGRGTVGIRPPHQAGLRVEVRDAKRVQFPGLQLDESSGVYSNERASDPGRPQIEVEIVAPELIVFERKRNRRGKWR